MGSKLGDVCFWQGGGGALCICVFGLQMIFETQRLISCQQYMQITFVLLTEPSGSVLKMNLPFISPSPFPLTFAFQSTVFFPKANPASCSSDSLSYSSAALWIKATGATDGCKSNNALSFFFFSINRALKKLTPLRGCCVTNALLN